MFWAEVPMAGHQDFHPEVQAEQAKGSIWTQAD